MLDTPIIQVENLRKVYGRVAAVNDISFEVYEGEIFGLLGPNGAGKTTTLEIIETLRQPTSGTVMVGGYNVEKQPARVKPLIGVQLQSAGFYPYLKLTEILELFASLYNTKIDPEKLLARVGLKDKSDMSVDKLSGGQKQRFSITTTLVHKPLVVFLDEPSTGLDPQARRNLWELIKDIRKEGTTIVLTTHFMDEAEYLCDRVAIIDEGRILKIGTPLGLIDELLARGFTKPKAKKEASFEDVFLDLTGKELRE